MLPVCQRVPAGKQCISKAYKSQPPQDGGLLPSQGHHSHQTCDDIQLNANCIPHTRPNTSMFFIAFITRFPAQAKLAPIKNDFIQKDRKGLQGIMD